MMLFIVMPLLSLRQAKANCFLLHVVHFPQRAQSGGENVASGIWRCAILSSINKVNCTRKSSCDQVLRRAGAGLAAPAGDKDFIPTMSVPAEGVTGCGTAPAQLGAWSWGKQPNTPSSSFNFWITEC